MAACSVVSGTLRPHGLQRVRLLCPWDFPGKNTGVGCHSLLQGIVPTQSLKPSLLHLLHWQADSLPLPHLGSPRYCCCSNHFRFLFGRAVNPVAG